MKDMPFCRCYHLGPESNHSVAEEYCKLRRSTLVLPDTRHELKMLQKYSRSGGYDRSYWLGYVKKNPYFVNNYSGKKMNEELFPPGYPDNLGGDQKCTRVPDEWSDVDDIDCSNNAVTICQY